MKALILILLFLFFTADGWGQTSTSYTYIDENNIPSQLDLYEYPTSNEAPIAIWYPSEHTEYIADDYSFNNNSFEFHFIEETREGDVLTDRIVSFSRGENFEQIKNLLSTNFFRSGFDHLPESCSEESSAFLIVTDSYYSSMNGYCLN